MIRRILALLAAAILSTAGVAVSPAPAAALAKVPVSAQSTLYGCADGTVCLYQWTTYGADRWSSTFSNFWNHPNGCINLTNTYWDNGTPVWDNSGSMIINGNSVWYPVNVQIYNSVNCNSNTGVASFPAWEVLGVTNLINVPFGGANGKAYHQIASVQVTQTGCTPSGC